MDRETCGEAMGFPDLTTGQSTPPGVPKSSNSPTSKHGGAETCTTVVFARGSARHHLEEHGRDQEHLSGRPPKAGAPDLARRPSGVRAGARPRVRRVARPL